MAVSAFPQEDLDIFTVPGIETDADAAGHRDLMTVKPEGFSKHIEESLRNEHRFLGRTYLLQEQDEFVTTPAGQGIRVSSAAQEPAAHALQQRIPHGVAEGIIDAFKSIEVEKEYGHHQVLAMGSGHRVPEPFAEEDAVRKSSQGIMVGKKAQPLLGCFPHGDIH